jgi:hypothetical protein
MNLTSHPHLVARHLQGSHASHLCAVPSCNLCDRADSADRACEVEFTRGKSIANVRATCSC